MTTQQKMRSDARERGLSWTAVRQAYVEIREEEKAKRQRPNEVREAAWVIFTANSPGCWPFWRTGFRNRFGRHIARGADHTIVPGYDELAQQIGWEFPEYADDDGTQRLFDFLFTPYETFPCARDLYRKAMGRVERQPAHTADIPF